MQELRGVQILLISCLFSSTVTQETASTPHYVVQFQLLSAVDAVYHTITELEKIKTSFIQDTALTPPYVVRLNSCMQFTECSN